MKWIAQDRSYELSTGRQFGVNQGIIGLSPQLRVYEGYDGGLLVTDQEAINSCDDNPWTSAERRELADAMIERWQAFKAEHGQ